MKRKKPVDKSVYRSFALVMQFGINMLVPIGMMSALGIYLDEKFGTSYIFILFFIIGAVAGGQNVYRMAKQVYDTPTKRRKKEHDSRNEDNGSIKE